MPLLRFKYGAHLSKEQVAELVAPHQDTLELVHSWLEHHGVPSSSISTSHGGGWLTITDVHVSQADELLCASYQLYRHTGTNETEVILRTVGYALPAALHTHVQTIAPTTHFASPRTLLQTPRNRSSEEVAVMVNATSGEPMRVMSRRDDTPLKPVTPSFLRWLYKTQGYVPAAMGRNVLGILGLQNEYPSWTDLTQFMTTHRADAVPATFEVEPVNGGGFDPTHPGTEASIDIQYASAMSYPTPQIFYSTGGIFRWEAGGLPGPGDAYLGWFKYLLSQPIVPPTISISYANPEPSLPPAYATAMCFLFAHLGLRGVSVLVSSGDNGVGSGDCKDSSGNVQFIPMFPASCTCSDLFLLSRSTQAQEVAHQTATVSQVPGSLVSAARKATTPRSRYTSPGAASHATFSARNTRTTQCFPSSNSSATSMPASTSAFAVVIRPNLLIHCNLCSPWGRGIPDIAAQAHRFSFVQDAEWYFVSGTSASTPVRPFLLPAPLRSSASVLDHAADGQCTGRGGNSLAAQ